jgi:hypothetical protein
VNINETNEKFQLPWVGAIKNFSENILESHKKFYSFEYTFVANYRFASKNHLI